jgi:Penicillin amidase
MSPRLAGLVLACAVLVLGPLRPAGAAEGVEEVTIYRDTFGIPHIFAASEEGAAYGMGYAQAEDRLEELLKQYRRASGTMAAVFGPDFLQHDYRQRLWQHQAVYTFSPEAERRSLFGLDNLRRPAYCARNPGPAASPGSPECLPRMSGPSSIVFAHRQPLSVRLSHGSDRSDGGCRRKDPYGVTESGQG